MTLVRVSLSPETQGCSGVWESELRRRQMSSTEPAVLALPVTEPSGRLLKGEYTLFKSPRFKHSNLYSYVRPYSLNN